MDCVREMTFEEEAKFYEKEARAEFAKETGNGDCSDVNGTLRRGMRIIRKAREDIDRSKEISVRLCDYNIKFLRENKKLKAEIERLEKENKLLTDNHPANTHNNCVAIDNGLIFTKTLADYDKLIGNIANEAIKEFAERLKTHLDQHGGEYTLYAIIDDVAKEMVGE